METLKDEERDKITLIIANHILQLRCPICNFQFNNHHHQNDFSMDKMFNHLLEVPCKLANDEVYDVTLTMVIYLYNVETHHIARDRKEEERKQRIPRSNRAKSYDIKCRFLHRLSKEFSLPDDLIRDLFECCTIAHSQDGEKVHTEMYKIRDYLYHGFLLEHQIKQDLPEWVNKVSVADSNNASS